MTRGSAVDPQRLLDLALQRRERERIGVRDCAFRDAAGTVVRISEVA